TLKFCCIPAPLFLYFFVSVGNYFCYKVTRLQYECAMFEKTGNQDSILNHVKYKILIIHF
ncbi:MAG TPA: hypothetical protein PLA68_02920, partial [Panacibacter sp.]|nr:hypothetical protein [Panacibacter sp.]